MLSHGLTVGASFALVACGGSPTSEATHAHDGGGNDAPLPDAAIGADADIGVDASSDSRVSDCAGGFPFADPVVEAAVRTELGKPSGAFTSDELSRVTGLSAPGAASLAGVQCLSELGVLVAYRGTIEDLAPLKGLTKLASVVLHENRIRSLQPLSDHPMRTIRVNDNQVASLAGLVLPMGSCEHGLEIQRNPINSSELQPYCARVRLHPSGRGSGSRARTG